MNRASFRGLTHLGLCKLLVDAGANGIREKGCHYLSKLESKRGKRIDLFNLSSTGTDGWIKLLLTGSVLGEEVPKHEVQGG